MIKQKSVIGIANCEKYMVFSLSRGLDQCVSLKTPQRCIHTETYTSVNTENVYIANY